MGLFSNTTQSSPLDGRECSYRHCTEPATVVMVEGPRPGRTFHDGAGITCDHHAAESQQDGCWTAWISR